MPDETPVVIDQQTDTLTPSVETETTNKPTEEVTPPATETPTVGTPTAEVTPITIDTPVNAGQDQPAANSEAKPAEEKKPEPPKMPARYTYDVYHIENPHNPVFEVVAEEEYPGKIASRVYKILLMTTEDPKKYTLTLRRIELL